MLVINCSRVLTYILYIYPKTIWPIQKLSPKSFVNKLLSGQLGLWQSNDPKPVVRPAAAPAPLSRVSRPPPLLSSAAPLPYHLSSALRSLISSSYLYLISYTSICHQTSCASSLPLMFGWFSRLFDPPLYHQLGDLLHSLLIICCNVGSTTTRTVQINFCCCSCHPSLSSSCLNTVPRWTINIFP